MMMGEIYLPEWRAFAWEIDEFGDGGYHSGIHAGIRSLASWLPVFIEPYPSSATKLPILGM
jgi:hypothetical protein